MYTSLSHSETEVTDEDIRVEFIEDKLHIHMGAKLSTYLCLSTDEAVMLAKKVTEALPVTVWV